MATATSVVAVVTTMIVTVETRGNLKSSREQPGRKQLETEVMGTKRVVKS